MRISVLILTTVALMLAGCVTTDLRVTNRVGTLIHVYSGHTKKVVTIPPDATVEVLHTSGRVIVITGRDEVWKYPAVQCLVDDEVVRGYKRISLPVDIGADGSIRLRSGRILKPTEKIE